MGNNSYDKDLFNFFSQLIEDNDEITILEEILSDKSNEEIINSFVASISEDTNDQD